MMVSIRFTAETCADTGVLGAPADQGGVVGGAVNSAFACRTARVSNDGEELPNPARLLVPVRMLNPTRPFERYIVIFVAPTNHAASVL
jgi:hypothetical protein